jgi:arylsulfatase A-like enzyme
MLGGVLTVTALTGCTVGDAADGAVTEATEAPNILMIIFDDLGYTDLRPYGGEADTPALDALAAEGTLFTDFHAYPVCAPTRAALMTGQDPHTKTADFEGGTRVPLIIKPPVGDDGPASVDAFAHISDLCPTFADYARATIENPGQRGTSIRGLIDGSVEVTQHEVFGMEWWGHRAYREGDWKLVFAPVPSGDTGTYALYDPGETADVSADNPDVVERLAAGWDRYAQENNVVAAPFDVVNAPAEMMSARIYGMDWAE